MFWEMVRWRISTCVHISYRGEEKDRDAHSFTRMTVLLFVNCYINLPYVLFLYMFNILDLNTAANSYVPQLCPLFVAAWLFGCRHIFVLFVLIQDIALNGICNNSFLIRIQCGDC